MRREVNFTLIVVVFCLAGCTRPAAKPLVPTGLGGIPSFLDLQPGWRLRVVVPIHESGRSSEEPHLVTQQGLALTFSSGSLAGYESQIVRLHGRSLLRMHPVSAELTLNGVTQQETKPSRNVLPNPGYAAALRLLYLQRSSSSDHDMALLGARSGGSLEELTAAVQHNPGACAVAKDRFCCWIPKGVAVIAEKKREEKWVPAM